MNIAKYGIANSQNGLFYFLKNTSSIAIPLTIQGVIMSSLSFVDVMMVSQLGDLALSSAGISSQIFFVHVMVIFGVASGAGIFIAQAHGRRDLASIQNYHALALSVSALVSALFFIFTYFFPEKIVSLYSTDKALLDTAANYLKISAPVYLFFFVSCVFSQVLRNVREVKIPMASTSAALAINTFLNYCLIFGNFGFPSRGLEGAAEATVISRAVEMIFILVSSYIFNTQAAIDFRRLSLSAKHIREYTKIAMPIITHSVFWAIGVNVYAMIYARSGIKAFAILSIILTIEKFGLILLSALGQASAIILGNHIGEGKIADAKTMSMQFIWTGVILALIYSFLVLAFLDLILLGHSLSNEDYSLAQNLMAVMCLLLSLKAANIVINMGVLRSGGDTMFSMCLDLGSVWLLGVPVALIASYYQLPLHYIILVVGIEELVKVVIGFQRVRQYGWVRKI